MTAVASLSDATRAPGDAWDQGDVIDAVYFAALDAVCPGVLVTPACDIEQDKVDLLTFVVLHRDEVSWLKEGKALTRGQREALSKKARELIGHRFARYHWIPVALGGHPAHVVDFSCVRSGWRGSSHR